MVRLLLFVLTAGVFGNIGDARAETLEFRADVWCPYNCDPGAEYEGYLIDLARRIYPAQGVEVDYILTPWARALHLAETTPNIAAPGAYPSRNRNHVFAEEPAGYSVNVFAIRNDTIWRFQGYDSLKHILLGVVGDYEYSDELTAIQKAYPSRFWALNGDQPLNRLLHMVRLGRIDAALDDINVIKHLLNHPQLGAGLMIGGQLPNAEIVSIAFSPAGPAGKRYSAIFSAGVRALRRSGELQQILARYGMEDWKQKTNLLQKTDGSDRRN